MPGAPDGMTLEGTRATVGDTVSQPLVAPPTEVLSRPAPQGWRRIAALMTRAGWRPWHYLLLLLVNAPVIASGTKAAGEDWQIVFYPWAEALRYSILRYGQFPWWNPWAAGGQPFVTDPVAVVLMPDTLAILAWGPVVGFKVLIIFYQLVGYEGSRRLCRHLFGQRPFVDAVSVIPIILPALALHFYPGHVCFFPVYLFPWLLYYGLTWHQSAGRALGLGVVVALYLLGYIHYAVIMAFTILPFVVLPALVRHIRSREVWLRAALAACAAMGLSFFRIVATYAVVMRFPRHERFYYPLVAPISEIIRTLVEPLQDPNTQGNVSGLKWWELGTYVGLLGLLLAYEGLRRGSRRLWPIHVGAFLCLVLAWNNRDPGLPSTYLHFVPPWSSMLVITRWRQFASFFILLGAVQGLVALRDAGRAKLAAGLALLLIGDLGFHFGYAIRDTFEHTAPPRIRGTDPPLSVWTPDRDHTWAHVRANQVALESETSLVGWDYRQTNHPHIGTPGYTGDFTLSKDLTLDEWTPNRIRMHGTPGALVAINVNPSNYWLLNGKRLFPDVRPIETDMPFQFRVPESGRVELVPRPPHLGLLVGLQAMFALAAVALYLLLARLARSRSDAGDRDRDLAAA